MILLMAQSRNTPSIILLLLLGPIPSSQEINAGLPHRSVVVHKCFIAASYVILDPYLCLYNYDIIHSAQTIIIV